jgi:hypothetical protein
MNKFVHSAIALTAVSASAFATDNGWVSLDQEINNLNASLSAQNATGPKVGGYVKVRYQNSGDVVVTDPVSGTDHDLSGFQLDNVRVEIAGDAGSDYSYKVSFDIASGTALLRDAYAKFQIGEQVYGKIGNFKANFLRSSTVADNKTVLLDRTILGNGAQWNTRDLGLEVGFGYDTLTFTVSAQNGTDLAGDELELCAKVGLNLMGGGVGKVEGAYGAGDQMALTAGLGYLSDSNLDNSAVIGLEVALTSGPFSIAGEMATLDTDDSVAFGPGGALSTSDSSPWDITGSYLFSDMWEGVVRFEEPDDADNSNVMTFGVNYFVSGHDIKWTAEYIAFTTDNAIGDVNVIAVGLAISM